MLVFLTETFLIGDLLHFPYLSVANLEAKARRTKEPLGEPCGYLANEGTTDLFVSYGYRERLTEFFR